MNYKNVYEMFLDKAAKYGNRTFIRHIAGGKWIDVSWSELKALVDKAALGLLRLGVRKGEAVNILADNCLEWLVADLAVVAVGGVTAAIYASNTPEECAYIIAHSESRVLFAFDGKQVEKLKKVREQIMLLKHVVVFKPGGATDFPGIMTFSDFISSGSAADEETRREYENRKSSITRDDLLTYIYTSGTTGPPKAAMLTHGNLLFIAEQYANTNFVTENDESLSILPLAHALERVIFYLSLSNGGTVSMSDDIYKTSEYLKVVKPTVLICVPRILEKVYEKIQSKAAASSPAQKAIFNWAVKTGKQASWKKNRGLPYGPFLTIKHAIAEKLLFVKIKESVGGRIRWLGSGGAPISPEIVEFFCAVGMPVIQAWGMTETTAPSTQMPFDAIRYDSVGKAIGGVDVVIADDGEILVRGGNVFKGYFKNPKDTESTLIDGWCHTGDLGEIDSDGYVKIVGRKKELIITSGGKNISPLNLEFLFMSSRYINQAVIVGDSKPCLTALFTLQLDELEIWAKDIGIESEAGKPLEHLPEVIEMISNEVDDKNKTLPQYMKIKNFRVIPGEFTQETGELTPTMKTKKNVIMKKYAHLIDEMYAK